MTREKHTLYLTNVYITKVLQYIIYRFAVDDLQVDLKLKVFAEF